MKRSFDAVDKENSPLDGVDALVDFARQTDIDKSKLDSALKSANPDQAVVDLITEWEKTKQDDSSGLRTYAYNIGDEEKADYIPKRKAYVNTCIQRAAIKFIMQDAKEKSGYSKLCRVVEGTWFGRKIGVKAASYEQIHMDIAKTLSEGGLRVGGLALKTMQMLSMRDDLPWPYRHNFAMAMESTGTVSQPAYVEGLVADAKLIEAGLTDWDKKPFRSASLAQVHDCRWQGKTAIMKVLHAHMRRHLFEIDLKIMGEICETFMHAGTPIVQGAPAMIPGIINNMRATVHSETDFKVEAENQQIVFRNFGGESVVVPKILHQSDSLLVMEKLDGMTGATALAAWKEEQESYPDVFNRVQRDAIYNAFATMIFQHKFYQSDSHAGNLMALKDGRVGIIDYGMCHQIPDDVQEKIAVFAMASPQSHEDLQPKKLKEWFALLGVDLTEDKAHLTTTMLCTGGEGGTMYPPVLGIHSDAVPIINILWYLTRFESVVAELRCKRGFADKADGFAVLRSFKENAAGGDDAGEG